MISEHGCDCGSMVPRSPGDQTNSVIGLRDTKARSGDHALSERFLRDIQ